MTGFQWLFAANGRSAGGDSGDLIGCTDYRSPRGFDGGFVLEGENGVMTPKKKNLQI